MAVVLPAVLAVGGTSTQTDAASFLVRLYEAVAGTIHERAATTALKFQAAMDAASVGKVTAVAASAAAFAGGGAVVAETHRTPLRGERRESKAGRAGASRAAEGPIGFASPNASAPRARPRRRTPPTRPARTRPRQA